MGRRSTVFGLKSEGFELIKNAMKLIRLSAVLSLACIFSLSAAEAASKKTIAAPKATQVAAPATGSNTHTGDGELNVTGSLGAVDGNFVWGPGLQLEWPVIIEGNSFAFGVQTGFYYSSMSQEALGVKASAKEWGIPLMVTGKYLIPTDVNILKPYLALAMGLGIDHTSGEAIVANTVTKVAGETNVHFTMLARPGVTFGGEQRWFAELPIGVMFTDFAILPTIGYHF